MDKQNYLPRNFIRDANEQQSDGWNEQKLTFEFIIMEHVRRLFRLAEHVENDSYFASYIACVDILAKSLKPLMNKEWKNKLDNNVITDPKKKTQNGEDKLDILFQWLHQNSYLSEGTKETDDSETDEDVV